MAWRCAPAPGGAGLGRAEGHFSTRLPAEPRRQRTQLLRTQRRASALDGVHKGLEEAHRKDIGEALRIRCHARQALHLHLVCAQRGVKALRALQAALARPPAASLARAACGALRKKAPAPSFSQPRKRVWEVTSVPALELRSSAHRV